MKGQNTMTPHMGKQKLYWLDLETTGLDPKNDYILELAMSEANLESPFEAQEIAHVLFGTSKAVLDTLPMSDWVRDTHTASGLFAEIHEITHGLPLRDIEDRLLKLVPLVDDPENRPTLAGSSVHFDHGFLKAHLPTLARRFMHRYYDVSAVKLFCRSLGMSRVPKAEAHRARADIAESIAHAKLCAEWLEKAREKR
jgi:oligoribonuclease